MKIAAIIVNCYSADYVVRVVDCWSLASECLDSRPQVSYYVRLLGQDGQESQSARFALVEQESVAGEVSQA